MERSGLNPVAFYLFSADRKMTIVVEFILIPAFLVLGFVLAGIATKILGTKDKKKKSF